MTDFVFRELIGQGSYAKVYRAKRKRKEVAIKVMNQNLVKREQKTALVLTERKIMSKLSHPHIVKFFFSFKVQFHDEENLYLVMELCKGGDLSDLIRRELRYHEEEGDLHRACSVETTRFYAAELVIALEYIHSMSIVHRDLKPDNLLLSADGHLKVTDFGTALDRSDPLSCSTTFCGTLGYQAPEVLHDQLASPASDLWAMGCIVFEMLVGQPPFASESDYDSIQMILNYTTATLNFPSSVPKEAQEFIRQLLVKCPIERLGVDARGESNMQALKCHEFFEGINWRHLTQAKPPPAESAQAPVPRHTSAI